MVWIKQKRLGLKRERERWESEKSSNVDHTRLNCHKESEEAEPSDCLTLTGDTVRNMWKETVNRLNGFVSVCILCNEVMISCHVLVHAQHLRLLVTTVCCSDTACHNWDFHVFKGDNRRPHPANIDPHSCTYCARLELFSGVCFTHC